MRSRIVARSPLKRKDLALTRLDGFVSLRSATAIQTVPTGLVSVPPSGPAIPVTLTAKRTFARSAAPSAIAHATDSLTAP